MKIPFRYLSAVLVNVLLPWLAYRLAAPHWGNGGGLIASMLPLVAWMSWDLLRHRHFDALSAIVLVGIVMSVAILPFGGGARAHAFEEPVVSGMIGLSFLVSLLLARPLVYYLGRSTIARESPEAVARFERDWNERPELVASIRLMTLVWGICMTMENIVRYWIVWTWPDEAHPANVSKLLSYVVYGGVMLWTVWYRRRMKARADDGTHTAQA